MSKQQQGGIGLAAFFDLDDLWTENDPGSSRAGIAIFDDLFGDRGMRARLDAIANRRADYKQILLGPIVRIADFAVSSGHEAVAFFAGRVAGFAGVRRNEVQRLRQALAEAKDRHNPVAVARSESDLDQFGTAFGKTIQNAFTGWEEHRAWIHRSVEQEQLANPQLRAVSPPTTTGNTSGPVPLTLHEALRIWNKQVDGIVAFLASPEFTSYVGQTGDVDDFRVLATSTNLLMHRLAALKAGIALPRLAYLHAVLADAVATAANISDVGDWEGYSFSWRAFEEIGPAIRAARAESVAAAVDVAETAHMESIGQANATRPTAAREFTLHVGGSCDSVDPGDAKAKVEPLNLTAAERAIPLLLRDGRQPRSMRAYAKDVGVDHSILSRNPVWRRAWKFAQSTSKKDLSELPAGEKNEDGNVEVEVLDACENGCGELGRTLVAIDGEQMRLCEACALKHGPRTK